MYIQDGKSPVILISSRYDLDIVQINMLVRKWLANNREQSSLDLYNLITAGEVIIKEGALFQIPTLSLEEAQTLVWEIHNKYDLESKDRWYHLKCYRHCFIGSELVDCLVKNKNIFKEEAIALGQDLFQYSLIRHVCDEHDFKDQFLFYRFQK